MHSVVPKPMHFRNKSSTNCSTTFKGSTLFYSHPSVAREEEETKKKKLELVALSKLKHDPETEHDKMEKAGNRFPCGPGGSKPNFVQDGLFSSFVLTSSVVSPYSFERWLGSPILSNISNRALRAASCSPVSPFNGANGISFPGLQIPFGSTWSFNLKIQSRAGVP